MNKAQQAVDRRGYLFALDGRKVFAEESYKALNYIIQSAESVAMKATFVRIAEGFEAAGIEYKQLLAYHDEVSYEINPQDVEKAREIIAEAFIEAPKKYGVDIMEAGDIETGRDYYGVH